MKTPVFDPQRLNALLDERANTPLQAHALDRVKPAIVLEVEKHCEISGLNEHISPAIEPGLTIYSVMCALFAKGLEVGFAYARRYPETR